jgi:hypothetical protein
MVVAWPKVLMYLRYRRQSPPAKNDKLSALRGLANCVALLFETIIGVHVGNVIQKLKSVIHAVHVHAVMASATKFSVCTALICRICRVGGTNTQHVTSTHSLKNPAV